MNATVDYFFTIASPWAYLGLDPLIELTTRHEAEVSPHVILILPENGAIPLNDRPVARRDYIRLDLQRWAKIRGKAIVLRDRPTLRNANDAALFVVAGIIEGCDWRRLCGALQRGYWEECADIGDAAVRCRIAQAEGIDGDRLVALETTSLVTERFAEDRELARTRGVFGSPTYSVDGQLYWGQDNLPFVDRHLSGDPLVPFLQSASDGGTTTARSASAPQFT